MVVIVQKYTQATVAVVLMDALKMIARVPGIEKHSQQ